MPSLRIKRGTEAQVIAAAGSSQLAAGEPYLLTDSRELAVGLGVSSFQALAKRPPKSPVFIYDGNGALTGITYADGSVKNFTYTSGNLTQVDFISNGVTVRKVFTYNSGALASITESII